MIDPEEQLIIDQIQALVDWSAIEGVEFGELFSANPPGIPPGTLPQVRVAGAQAAARAPIEYPRKYSGRQLTMLAFPLGGGVR